MQLGKETLDEALVFSARKAIFDVVGSKTYLMREKDVIKLFLILRELDARVMIPY